MYLKETINYLKHKTTYKDDHTDWEPATKITFKKVIIVVKYMNRKDNFETEKKYDYRRVWMSAYYKNSAYNCKNPFYFDYKLDDRLHITTTATGIMLDRSENYKISESQILIQENLFNNLEINLLFGISELYDLLFVPNILCKYRADVDILCY